MDAINPRNSVFSPQDSLEAYSVLGPTGSGKSTAMLHLILADIKAGRSVLVLDPKLTWLMMSCQIPEERMDDVVIIDPSIQHLVGLTRWRSRNTATKR